MMNLVVLAQPEGWYGRQLAEQARSRGHTVTLAEFPRFVLEISSAGAMFRQGESLLQKPDAVIVRTMPAGSLEQVVYRMDVLQRLAAAGVKIVNSPQAIEAAVDKFLTTARLAGQGLPTPATIVCESADDACAAFERLGGDVVVKPLFGSEGRGILRVSDPDLASRAFRTLERLQAVIYLQEFIRHRGSDIRVLVLDGRPLGAMERSHSTDFRTNIARNAVGRLHVLTDEEARLAVEAAAAVGACFSGVDLMYDPEGRCLVIEVNAVPGWKAFEKITGVPVAVKLLEYLETQSCR